MFLRIGNLNLTSKRISAFSQWFTTSHISKNSLHYPNAVLFKLFFIKYKIISSQNSLFHYLNAKVTFMLIQKLVALTVSAWWHHHWSCVNVRVRCSKIKVLLAVPPAFLLSIAPHVRMLPVDLGRYGELIGNIPNSCFERWEGKLPLTGRISRNIMIFKALFKLNVSFLPRTSTA